MQSPLHGNLAGHMSSDSLITGLVPQPECKVVLYLCTDMRTSCQFSAEAAEAVHPSHLCVTLQGMQELHKAAPQTAGGEADPETQQAVQRVFNLVRNGACGSAAKDCNLTLDDVVRFYNVSSAPACNALDLCTMAPGPGISQHSISMPSAQPSSRTTRMSVRILRRLTMQVWVRELAAALLQAEDRSSSMGQGSVEELIVAGVSLPP